MVVDKGYDNISSNEEFFPFGENLTRGAAWEFLTRMDLDIAYSSEKVFNLEMFMTQVADRASDFDFTMGGSEDLSSESIEKAFEFDILSGILNSEAKEIETFMSCLQRDINNARSKFSQSGNSNEISPEIEEKLLKAEEALRCSNDQVSDILKQSGKFERSLAVDEDLDTGQFSPVNAQWKLQTAEQQRHFLQTLEKSLEREMELERKLSDSRNNEEDLKLKLHLAVEEVDWLEELMEVMMERMLAAENSAEFLIEILREYASCIQNAHSSTSGSSLQEHTLRGRVDALEEQLRECENQLQLAKVSVEESNIQQIILYSKLGDMGKVIVGLRDNALVIQDRAEHAEARCAQLIKVNAELNNEVSFLRNNGMEKANSLERKLKESDTQLEHAKASVEAIEEQQSMLYSALNDMEHVIEDLKGKVSKAENRAESAENKCTLLTDTNLELNEELSFLRGRMECLEASLRQSDRAKVATAKDIGNRTKLITELVKKLALEREQLQLQDSSKSSLSVNLQIEPMDSLENHNKVFPQPEFALLENLHCRRNGHVGYASEASKNLGCWRTLVNSCIVYD
ncbi:hypothetical protein HPP92_016364 [Vanilla planifolia]|uniref:WIT1/2 N-terminal helical bundle domain-containing protein n=1 Tax=Vanilla planifolia TaxID=51239 RepID=A0A835US09_VANPL|nr:hypothetical protein HPP92_016364 [Vanilla planifolia]